MNKGKIILADSSYTIRRIVELSFSEIEGVEVISFDNGSDLKEKLLQFQPDVIIVDTKLPQLNGYDICRFVNQTPALKKVSVYLMKGGFDSVSEDLLKGLKFEGIITKPFDSSALVQSVVKLLEAKKTYEPIKTTEEIPSSMPEDFSEIEAGLAEGEDISFSDIREEIESEGVIPDELMTRKGALEREEILPSEEITQGTQPPKVDHLAPETEEQIENPFADESKLEIKKVREDVSPSFFEIEKKQVKEKGAFGLPDKEQDLDLPEVSGREEKLEEFADEQTSVVQPKTRIDLESPATQKREPVPDKLEILDNKEPFRETGKSQRKPLDEELSDLKLGSFQDLITEGNKAEKKEKSDDKEKISRLIKKDALKEMITDGLPFATDDKNAALLEDRLTVVIKELLWEIIPPLAEKVIKEEVGRIKAELDKSQP